MRLSPVEPGQAFRFWTGKCIRGHSVRLEASKPGVQADSLIKEPGPAVSIKDTKLAAKSR